MKTSQFIIVLIIGILLTAFITNPDRKKHSEKATEILLDVNENNENYGILGGLISGFATNTVEGNIKIKNYYLFSKSYIFSPSRNKKLDLGLGIFGQIISLSNYDDVQQYLDQHPGNLDKKSGDISNGEIDNKADSENSSNQKVENSDKNMRNRQEDEAIINSIMGVPEDSISQDSTGYYN